MQTNPEHSSSAPVFASTDLSCHFAQMSASEIAQELEQVLDTMTAETYDGSLIDAYLDELDRLDPLPRRKLHGPLFRSMSVRFLRKMPLVLSPSRRLCSPLPISENGAVFRFLPQR